MSETTRFIYFLVAVTAALLSIFYIKYQSNVRAIKGTDLNRVAHLDLYNWNNTNDLVGVMTRYFYAILVKAYKANRYTTAFDSINAWCKNDVDSSVREEVTEASNNASSRFWSIIDDSNLTGSEPNFKVSYVVDYHVLPKSILHNDLLPMNNLIEQLDQNLWR